MFDTIIFDWGDTLMADLPNQAGPMAAWPEVKLIPGADAALGRLVVGCTLAVATNANVSKEADVRAALARVGLDGWISAVFTAAALGLSKQDPGFYPAVLRGLGLANTPARALMVGDGYPGDVLAARAAGLRTVWYNPSGRECPGGVPWHEGEVTHLADLPRLLETGLLPSIEECLAWVEEEGSAPQIIAHSRTVAGAAYRLAVWLRAAGEAVDPLLAHRGGLLHDLDKLTSRGTAEAHGQRSFRLLVRRGQPQLAEIARRHIISHLGGGEGPSTWEEKLVFYADKIAEGAELVPFQQRLAALMARYPDYAAGMQANAPLVEVLEAGICARLGLSPAELVNRLRTAQDSAEVG